MRPLAHPCLGLPHPPPLTQPLRIALSPVVRETISSPDNYLSSQQTPVGCQSWGAKVNDTQLLADGHPRAKNE